MSYSKTAKEIRCSVELEMITKYPRFKFPEGEYHSTSITSTQRISTDKEGIISVWVYPDITHPTSAYEWYRPLNTETSILEFIEHISDKSWWNMDLQDDLFSILRDINKDGKLC